ncbi:MAG: response regulator [Candidatus Altiarchaeota archaeon]
MAERILIVDDEPHLARVAKEALIGEGYEIDTALTGRDAIAKLEKQPADLVLMDVIMPGLKPKEILDEISAKGLSPKVIYLTAVKFRDESDFQRQHGFVPDYDNVKVLDYIEKPYDIEDLVFRVKRALED